MRFISVLSLIFLFLAIVNCLELMNICEEDHFLYQDQQVNSYHLLNTEVDLPNLEVYYLDVKTDLKKIIPAELANLLIDYKTQYNKLMLNVYSQKFLSNYVDSNEIENNLNLLKEIRLKTESIFAEVFDLEKETPETRHLYGRYLSKYNNFENLLNVLIKLKNHNIGKELLPEEKLFNHLDKLNNQIQINQDPIFTNEEADIYYSSNLYKFNLFKFNRASKLFFNLKSNGTIYFSIYLPFYDSKFVSQKVCTKSKDLPEFFKKH